MVRVCPRPCREQRRTSERTRPLSARGRRWANILLRSRPRRQAPPAPHPSLVLAPPRTTTQVRLAPGEGQTVTIYLGFFRGCGTPMRTERADAVGHIHGHHCGRGERGEDHARGGVRGGGRSVKQGSGHFENYAISRLRRAPPNPPLRSLLPPRAIAAARRPL